MSRQIVFALSLFFLTALFPKLPALSYTGTIIDGATKRPVEDAIVTLQNVVVRSDHDGKFQISGDGDAIGLRAYGYARQSIAVGDLKDRTAPLALTPMCRRRSIFRSTASAAPSYARQHSASSTKSTRRAGN